MVVSHRRLFRSTALLVGLVLAGCDVEDADAPLDEPVEAKVSAFTARMSFDDCTPTQKARFQEAAGVVTRQIAGDQRDEMLACLTEATLSGDMASYPEELMRQLREDETSVIFCEEMEPLIVDHPGGTGSTETMGFDDWFIVTPCAVGGCEPGVDDRERLASMLLHQIAHTKGLDHADALGPLAPEDPHSVPHQVERCSLSISAGQVASFPRGDVPRPNGAMRSAPRNVVELARVGTNGGQPFGYAACNFDDYAMGLRVRTGGMVDAMSLRCQSEGSTAVHDQLMRGGTGGVPAELNCPAGSYMVGVRGRAGAALDAIAPVCAPAATLHAASVAVDRSIEPRGGSGGEPFERLCPVGMAVRAYAGRSGWRIDQLKLLCVDFEDLDVLAAVNRLDTAGSASGTRYVERCPTGAITALVGRSGTLVERLGAECREMRHFGDVLLPLAGLAYALAAHGGSPWVSLDKPGAWPADACAPGSALVGLELRAGGKIDRIRGLCASSDAWARKIPGTTTEALDWHGGGGGSLVKLMCPLGQFIVGWEIREADGKVSAIQPMCSQF